MTTQTEVNARLDIERAIVRKLCRLLKAGGYPPSQVWDGGEYVPTTTENEVIEAVFAVDEATIHFSGGDEDCEHGVLIILGNGVDCISDYHCGDNKFDTILHQVQEWIDDEQRSSGKIKCPKCDYQFAAACGAFGCPNCLGEGLT